MDDAIKKRPLGVTILAIILIVGSLSSFADLIFGGDFPVFTVIFRKQIFGTFAYIYNLVSNLFCFFLGIGLLKLKKLAWQAFIGSNVLGFFMFILDLLFFGFAPTKIIIQGQSTPEVSFGFILIGRTFYFAFLVLTTLYFFKKKEYFK